MYYLTHPAFDGLFDDNTLYKVKNAFKKRKVYPFPNESFKVNPNY